MDLRIPVVLAATLLAPAASKAQMAGDIFEGQLVAERSCAECHAVHADDLFMPLADAPAFVDVAETPGLTSLRLRAWLRTSHPTMPNIILNDRDTDDVTAYILSLERR